MVSAERLEPGDSKAPGVATPDLASGLCSSSVRWLRERLASGDAGAAAAAAHRIEPSLTPQKLATCPDLSTAAGAALALAEAHLLAGSLRDSMPMSRLALLAGQQTGDPVVAAQAAGLRAVATAINGEREDARWWLRYAREEIDPAEAVSTCGGLWSLLLAEAFLRFTDGDDAGLADLRRRAAASERLRPDLGWILAWIGGFIAILRADLAKDPQALLASSRTFRTSDRRPPCPPLLSGMALNREARSLVHLGRPGRALEIENDLPDHLGDAVCFATDRATAHLARGRPELTLERTEECLRAGTRHALYQLGPIRLRRAVALERLDRPAAASREFSLAWHLIHEIAVLPIMGIRAEDMTDLFLRLRRSEPDFYGRLVSDPRAPTEVAAAVGPVFDLSVLSERELEVAGHLVTGATLTQIADLMTVSRNTVKTQVRAIYRKLGVRSRAQAIETLRRLGHRPASGPSTVAPGNASGS